MEAQKDGVSKPVALDGREPGRRQAKVQELFESQGADAAWVLGLRLKIRESTLRTWFAIALLEQVVQRHPFYAPAHSMLAFVLLVSRQGGWHLMEPQVTQAANLAARAVELDDSDPVGASCLGLRGLHQAAY